MNTSPVIEKIATVRPEVYEFLLAAAPEIQESPFRDEIVQEMDYAVSMAKIANSAALSPMPSAAPNLGHPGLGAAANYGLGIAGIIGAGIAYSLAGDMYDAARRGITKSRNYRQMLDADPELKNLHPQKVRSAFETLHRFNPEFSGDPMVAASFVKRQATLDGGYTDVREIESLIGARRNLRDIRSLPVPHSMPMWDRESKLDKAYKAEQIQKLRQDIALSADLHPEQKSKLKEEVKRLGQQNDQRIFSATVDKIRAEAEIQKAKSDKQWLGYQKAQDKAKATIEGHRARPTMRGLEERELSMRASPEMFHARLQQSLLAGDRDAQEALRTVGPTPSVLMENLQKAQTNAANAQSELTRLKQMSAYLDLTNAPKQEQILDAQGNVVGSRDVPMPGYGAPSGGLRTLSARARSAGRP